MPETYFASRLVREGRIGHIPALAPATKGHSVLCFLSQGLKLFCHVVLEQRRIDQTGKHRVATDILFAVLHCQLSSELHQSDLRGRIADVVMTEVL